MKIIEIKNKLGEIIIPKKWEPIGKILTFDREIEMSKYYYGTWELTLKERSPIGINPDSTDDRFKTAGNQFGEKEHTLKIEEMPKHSHKTGISGTTFYSGAIGYDTAQVKVEQTSGLNTASTGGDKPHNNIHPVEIVYFYKRVA